MKSTNHKTQPEHHDGFNVGDIYFVLFRQKWIILAFSVLGFIGAAVVSFLKPAQYESETKVYVQYVEAAAKHAASDPQMLTTEKPGEIVDNELEFLRSLDVAQQVVASIGADKILEKLGGGDDTNAAAGVVLRSLTTDEIPKTSSTFRISVQFADKDMARAILSSFLEAYKNKSAGLHSPQADPEILTNQIVTLHGEIHDIQAQLIDAKQATGIISTPEETRKGLNDRNQEIKRKLEDAELDQAGAGVALTETERTPLKTQAPTNVVEEVPMPKYSEAKVREYKNAVKRVAKTVEDLEAARIQYPDTSPWLEPYKLRKDQAEAEAQRLERENPQIANYSLTVIPSPTSPPEPGGNPMGSMVQSLVVMQTKAKIAALHIQLDRINTELKRLEDGEQLVNELQNQLNGKNLALKSTEERLELAKNHANQEYTDGIKIYENPTPAIRKRSKQAKKLMMGALGGGVIGGLALAFLIEMVLDRSIKRPGEIETKLRLPLFISIPDVNGDAHRGVTALTAGNHLLLTDANGGALVQTRRPGGEPPIGEIESWDSRHTLHRFYAGLRDRLIVNFEVRNLNHNPKLVGVTSCHKGAGVSTVAAGLAASLSETGEGNVLFVDMRGDQGAAQQFHKGKPVSGIDATLGDGAKNGAFMRDDFHAAGEGAGDQNIPSVLSKRFATLMPKLKASDYDYIVFDMPPVSQTSMTARLSGLMDMVLLVIESEKTNRDSVKRATALLSESKAHVSTVLNKVHTYVPTRLHQEYLDDEA